MNVKSLFDYILALLISPVIIPLIILLVVFSTFDTRAFGLFRQNRVGKNGTLFQIWKIRSMRGNYKVDVTTNQSHEITKFGQFIRRTHLDELPQLINILKGEMSFVGPRPDVPGYADQLKGEDRIILSVKPGITGPAQLAFKNEEEILNQKTNPLLYNDEVLWPQKIRMNKEYVQKQSFLTDLLYICKTLFQ